MTPDFINESVLWGPLYALGVFAALVLVAAIAQAVFQLVLHRRMRSAPDALNTQILSAVRGPAVLFIVLLGLFLGVLVLTSLTSPTFDVLDGWDTWVRKAWVVVIVAEVSYLASHLTQFLIAWYLRAIAARTTTDLDAKLLPPIRRVLPLTIYFVGALVALDNLDISISPLLAGLGIGGLAVALAVQPTLSNFFAGTYLVTEGELKEGDFIELESGPSGYIAGVGWRSTKIRSRYNNLIIVPNSHMASSVVTNYSSPSPAMNVIVTCGVSYDADLERVENLVMQVAQQVIDESPDAVKENPPYFGFSEFGDSNIDFWVFLQARDRWGTFTVTNDLIKRIHARFKEEDIEINYPMRKLVASTSNGRLPLLEAQEPPGGQSSSGDEAG